MPRPRLHVFAIAGPVFSGILMLGAPGPGGDASQRPAQNPWGTDHVGRPIPEYVTGDECLFCHRIDIGADWASDPHGHTIRAAGDERGIARPLTDDPDLLAFLDKAVYALGRDRRIRFLKPGRGYGKLDLATVQLRPTDGDRSAALLSASEARWDENRFAAECAGCHATAVAQPAQAFSAISIDCFSCHGAVELEHADDPKLVLFAESRRESARTIASVCGQCHLRGGKSRSTGLPYPNQYVPGDNLFRDFEVDFSEDTLAALNAGDRHVYQNIREMIFDDRPIVTCLSCHEVHRNSSVTHAAVSERRTDTCVICHDPNRPKSEVRAYEVHSPICDYE